VSRILRVDWNRLKKNCKYDLNSAYRVLCAGAGIKGKYTIKERELSLTLYGDSYIINPHRVLTDRNSNIESKIQYIELACMRNYFDYKLAGDSTLELLLVDPTTIQHNPLLKVVNNKIHFKFEGE
jgi:hypothetical protein